MSKFVAGHMTRIMCSVNFGIGKIPTHCSKEALVLLPLSVSGLFLLKSPSPDFCTETLTLLLFMFIKGSTFIPMLFLNIVFCMKQRFFCNWPKLISLEHLECNL